ncbi:MAG: glycosyltransferase family 2 protein [Pseudorhizobium sp.]
MADSTSKGCEIGGRLDECGNARAAVALLLGVVVIGRNEGDRLAECLASLRQVEGPVVYVDSGSTDDSVTVARRAGADVVSLDPAVAFTAARARNAGWRHLLQKWPHLSYVQFLDGDCRIDPRWLPAAVELLRQRHDVAVVFGRRRERYPTRSIYNAICDDEWAGPAGEVMECGGDVLLRAEVLRQLGGYRDDLIAGEEPELCVRLRQLGHRVWRLDCEMSLHDAHILRFRQWWRRSVRAGHAYAQVHLMHQRTPERIWGANLRRTLSWSILLPATVIAAFLLHPAWLGLVLLYPIQVLRLHRRQRSLKRATLCVVGKFAEMQGVLQYVINRISRRRQRLIEYK